VDDKIKIFWLDDDLESIETEAFILLPDRFGDKIDIIIETNIAGIVDRVDELGLENIKNNKNIIFIIDIMLNNETRYISFDNEEKFIKNNLVAGVEFYQNSLYDFSNCIIFYSSRRYDRTLFQNIIEKKENLFFIEKDKREGEFVDTLTKLVEQIFKGGAENG